MPVDAELDAALLDAALLLDALAVLISPPAPPDPPAPPAPLDDALLDALAVDDADAVDDAVDPTLWLAVVAIVPPAPPVPVGSGSVKV
jgi:hypothetical protein